MASRWLDHDSFPLDWDPWVNLFQQIAEGLLLFHPAVWIVSRWIRIERECCCDEVVLQQTGEPQTYAETLAYLAMPDGFSLVPSLALARHPLVGRIRRILQWQDHGLGFSPILFIGLMLVFLTGLTMAVGMARSQTVRETLLDEPVSRHHNRGTGFNATGDPCTVPALPALPVPVPRPKSTDTRINTGLQHGTQQASSPGIFPIMHVTATALSSHDDRMMGPEKTIDGSGLDELGRHSTQATGSPKYTADTIVDLEATAAKYVRLWIHNGWGRLPQHGLSEVRFFYTD